MVRNKLPLETHPAFHATSLDALAEHIKSYLAAPVILLPDDNCTVDARSNHIKLEQSELWYCAYGLPLVVDIPDSGYLRLQVRYRGSGATHVDGRKVAITRRQACISTGAVRIEFAADFEKAVWRLPRAVLAQKLSLMTGRAVERALDFDSALDLSRPEAANLTRILACLFRTVDVIEGSAASIVITELEQAFMATFLASTNHSGRHLLDLPVAHAAPWQVRRAENHIEANWNKPITIEDLVAVTGVSTRTLFRTFRIHRGYSPLEFARRIRLDRARQMLENPEATTTVTEVALICGFGDLSRFSTHFLHTFGVRPSVLLNRARNMAATKPIPSRHRE